jgi:hypothetical protein
MAKPQFLNRTKTVIAADSLGSARLGMRGYGVAVTVGLLLAKSQFLQDSTEGKSPLLWYSIAYKSRMIFVSMILRRAQCLA